MDCIQIVQNAQRVRMANQQRQRTERRRLSGVIQQVEQIVKTILGSANMLERVTILCKVKKFV